VGVQDTDGLGIKIPPDLNQAYGGGGQYPYAQGRKLIDAVITNTQRMYLVSPGLDDTTFPDLGDADTRMVFDTIQAAINEAQTRFDGGDAVIVVMPGVYDENLVFNGRCRLHLVAPYGRPRWKQMASYGGAHVRGDRGNGTTNPVIQITQSSSAPGICAISFEGMTFSNETFVGTTPGSLGSSILHCQTSASWTGTQIVVRFLDCLLHGEPQNGESITRAIGWGYTDGGGDPANVSNYQLVLDRCRLAGFPNGGSMTGVIAVSNGGVGTGTGDGARKLCLLDTEVYSDGVTDGNTLSFDLDLGDVPTGIVAKCRFSKAIDDVDNLIGGGGGGGVGDVHGLNQSPHGQGSLGNEGSVPLLDWLW